MLGPPFVPAGEMRLPSSLPIRLKSAAAMVPPLKMSGLVVRDGRVRNRQRAAAAQISDAATAADDERFVVGNGGSGDREVDAVGAASAEDAAAVTRDRIPFDAQVREHDGGSSVAGADDADGAAGAANEGERDDLDRNAIADGNVEVTEAARAGVDVEVVRPGASDEDGLGDGGQGGAEGDHVVGGGAVEDGGIECDGVCAGQHLRRLNGSAQGAAAGIADGIGVVGVFSVARAVDDEGDCVDRSTRHARDEHREQDEDGEQEAGPARVRGPMRGNGVRKRCVWHVDLQVGTGSVTGRTGRVARPIRSGESFQELGDIPIIGCLLCGLYL